MLLKLFFQENVACKIEAILLWPRCINYGILTPNIKQYSSQNLAVIVPIVVIKIFVEMYVYIHDI